MKTKHENSVKSICDLNIQAKNVLFKCAQLSIKGGTSDAREVVEIIIEDDIIN